jgi:hypothetical protein
MSSEQFGSGEGGFNIPRPRTPEIDELSVEERLYLRMKSIATHTMRDEQGMYLGEHGEECAIDKGRFITLDVWVYPVPEIVTEHGFQFLRSGSITMQVDGQTGPTTAYDLLADRDGIYYDLRDDGISVPHVASCLLGYLTPVPTAV